MATLLTTTGKALPVKPRMAVFTLDELQKFVRGYIEIVTLPGGQLMIINEYGHFDPTLQLKENKKATKLYKKHFYKDVIGNPMVVPIVGDVVICSKSEIAA